VIANPASSQEICAGGNRVIAMVGNHAPRQCRIATFTTDWRDTISAEVPGSDCFVLAMNDPGKRYAYPERVRFEIAESDLTSYRRAADFLNVNGVDVVCLQCATSVRGTTLAGVAGKTCYFGRCRASPTSAPKPRTMSRGARLSIHGVTEGTA